MQKPIRILTNDQPPCYLGTLTAPQHYHHLEDWEFHQLLLTLQDEWREEQEGDTITPDYDFVEFLLEKGFEEVSNDPIFFTLER